MFFIMNNVYCFNIKLRSKISNLIENEIFLNVDQDCLETNLFIINEILQNGIQ